MKKIKIIILTLLGLVMTGCAKIGDVEVFRFVNPEIELVVGQSTTLDLIYGEYSRNSIVEFTKSSEDIISLEEGVATALKVGEVTVTATIAGGTKTTTIIRVVQEPINSMKITAPDTLIVNQSTTLSVTVNPSHLPNSVIWSIENSPTSFPNGATITQTGVFTAGSIGEKTAAEYLAKGIRVVVVATSTYDPLMSVKKEIRVRYPSTTSVVVSAEKTDLLSSETIQLNATILPANGYIVATYSSSDSTIASVNSTGLVTASATKEGQATITVTTLDGKTGTIIINVTKP